MPLTTWLAFFVASWLISVSPGRRRALVHGGGHALRLRARTLEHPRSADRPPAPCSRSSPPDWAPCSPHRRSPSPRSNGWALPISSGSASSSGARRQGRWRRATTVAIGGTIRELVRAGLSRQRDKSEGHRVHARGAAAVHRSREAAARPVLAICAATLVFTDLVVMSVYTGLAAKVLRLLRAAGSRSRGEPRRSAGCSSRRARCSRRSGERSDPMAFGIGRLKRGLHRVVRGRAMPKLAGVPGNAPDRFTGVTIHREAADRNR